MFDTDILIWYFRGSEKAKGFIVVFPFEKKAIPSVVSMELLQGCLSHGEIRTVKKFVAQNFSDILHPDVRISQKAIALLERHALQGLRIADALIAATALLVGCRLATANVKHDRLMKGLALLPFLPEEQGR